MDFDDFIFVKSKNIIEINICKNSNDINFENKYIYLVEIPLGYILKIMAILKRTYIIQ